MSGKLLECNPMSGLELLSDFKSTFVRFYWNLLVPALGKTAANECHAVFSKGRC